MSWSHQPKASNPTHSLCRTESSLSSLMLKFTFDFNGRRREFWCIKAPSGKVRADIWDGTWLPASSHIKSLSQEPSCPASGPCSAPGSPPRVTDITRCCHPAALCSLPAVPMRVLTQIILPETPGQGASERWSLLHIPAIDVLGVSQRSFYFVLKLL